MTEIDLDEALEFYRKHLEQLRERRERRRNPEARKSARDLMRRRRHPDWNPKLETWDQHHQMHLKE